MSSVDASAVGAEVDPFGSMIGQTQALARLSAAVTDPVHAYLFVGPRGAGKRRAASIFGGELIGRGDDRERTRRLALAGEHPDLVLFEPEGNTLLVKDVDPIVVEASRSPVEGSRKVILIDRFHVASPEAAAKLLKPIEEPPPSTIFILLTEEVRPEHVTIASRSTQIDFPAVPVSTIRDALVERGVDPEVAQAAASGSGGDVSRADLLVTDAAFTERRSLWWDVPARLDGTGYAVAELVGELRLAVDEAQGPLDARHLEELARLEEIESMTGTRGSGRRALEVRQKRETRAHRTDEWRMGLATLAQRYRSDMDQAVDTDVFGVLTDAADALVRNPGEQLWLSALLLSLPSL